MQNKNSLSKAELDNIVRQIPLDTKAGTFMAPPKEWVRTDCGQIEVYVGDRIFVCVAVEKMPDTPEELIENQINTEQIVIKYLQSEGFIDRDFAYVGFQKFQIRP